MKALKLFYSYSHKDEPLRAQLETHLKLLQREGYIAAWHDRRILGGQEWKGQIDDNLTAADVILLLVSADFIASDYCYDIEMKAAMERHERKQAIVIPVIIRDCDWHSAPFGKHQVLPKDGKAVELWKPRSTGWKDVAQGMRRLVEAWPAQREEAASRHAEVEKRFCEYVITKHSKLTLYSITADRPLSVELEKVFVTLTTKTRFADANAFQDIINASWFQGSEQLIWEFPRRKLTDLFSEKDKDLWESIWQEARESSWFNIKDRVSKLFISHRQLSELDAEVTLSLNAALHTRRSLVIVGEPGAGKSTVLKYLALKFARHEAKEKLELDEQRLPVLIPLRDFNVHLSHSFRRAELTSFGPNVLPEFLHQHFQETAPHLKIPDHFFSHLLEAGRCILLLDGLDEVADPSHRTRMAELIADIIGSPLYAANRFVITSRPTGYTGEPRARLSPHCADCTIRPFEDTDMEQFTRAWYHAVVLSDKGENAESRRFAEDRATSLIRSIRGEPRVRLLAQNPLLMSVLAMVHQRNIELPRLRARLYEECTDFLLGYWDETKGGEAARELARFGEFDRDGKRTLLEPIALWLHERGEQGTEVDRAELEEQFADQFARCGNDKTAARQRAQLFLQVIADRSGLLVERGTGVFAFAHLTFQEYLAARALADREDGTSLVLNHLHEPWWREVTLLHGSVLSDTRIGANTARRRTREFLEAIRNAKSWKEEILQRDLFLAICCMGDMEVLGVDEDWRCTLTDNVLALWKKTRWERQRNEVATALGNSITTPQGQRFTELLLDEMGQGKSELRERAAAALGRLGSAAATAAMLERLLVLSKDANYALRVSAASALGGLGSSAATPAVLERLLVLIQDANDQVRWCAASALARLGSAAATPTVLEGLLAMVQNTNDHERRTLAFAWDGLGSAAATPVVLERLLALIQDANDAVRLSAASALGNLGSAAATPAVLEHLLALSLDPNDAVRWMAASALGSLGRSAATPVVLERLLVLIQDANVQVSWSAASAFGHLGSAAATPTVLERLLGFIQGTNDNARTNAAFALGRVGSAAATPALLERLLVLSLDPNDAVRMSATSALGGLGSAAATPAVIERLLALSKDANYALRVSAASALGGLGSAAATPAVLERLLALSLDPNDAVRWGTASALGNLGSSAATPAVLERLLVLSKDVNDTLRRSAIASMAKIEVPPELGFQKRVLKFWEEYLLEKELNVWSKDFETLGNCAYGQLQRLAANAARFGASARTSKGGKGSVSKTILKNKKNPKRR
jgi:HEAT repeat protein/energy-coupling factor transporter ATP-binding protein EcfA2